ncbi:phosphatase PAP2 family protein [Steroidobacter sp. S1-65]|uniref:Phosphatase PAP2 family protein n=1 Tax=Steroidobacter gossypii TaxID=2805490 RepID=A0ABS1WY64_9GAMM|nr:phosphatase PAP2 family protein [Steroidobacter gossypii]MBM0105908.1 phosphatase PAP2 family protein [Steroidobacter gossypii]
MSNATFYWRHLRTPLALFAILAPLFAVSTADLAIAHALFFDESRSRWIGATSWWTNELIHRDGAWLIRTIAALALSLWAATWLAPQWRAARRPALYFFVSVVLSVGLVGLLKALTNVSCPRELAEFGGAFPYLHLFEHRPVGLGHGRCFPAAHASSGYSLLALYFMLRERSARAASIALASAVALGLTFGLAQQSRGAHFMSHDMWSAMIVWTVALSLYSFVFQACLWDSEAHPSAGTPPRWP